MKLFPLLSLPVIPVMLAGMLSMSTPLSGQIRFPAASPHARLVQTVGATEIEIDYSRPGAKGREIFGGLVPYGKVWRTGANASTKISFAQDVRLEGQAVPAGTYALYTIPEADEWTVILSTNTELWGAFDYDEADDVVRVTVTPEELQEPVENFTIGFDELTDGGAVMYLDWVHTRVPVQVKTTDAERIMTALKEDMPAIEEAGAGLLYNAANYYRKNDGDLGQAQEWIDAAAEQQPAAYWVQFEKAQIEAARGADETAVKSAETALERARAGGADGGMTAAIQAFIDERS